MIFCDIRIQNQKIGEKQMSEQQKDTAQEEFDYTLPDESKEEKKKRKRRKRYVKQIRKWMELMVEILKAVAVFGAFALVFKMSDITTGNIEANAPFVVGNDNPIEYNPYFDQRSTTNVENFINNEVEDEN